MGQLGMQIPNSMVLVLVCYNYKVEGLTIVRGPTRNQISPKSGTPISERTPLSRVRIKNRHG